MTIAPAIEYLGDFEVNRLPSGAVVYYRDSDHSYWGQVQEKAGRWSGVQAARLTGVTTVIGPFDWIPDFLMKWAVRLDREGVAALAGEALGLDDIDDLRAALAWLRSGEDIAAALEGARLDWDSTRDDAAKRGTNVHLHALHALAAGQPVPAFNRMTEEERGYARGVVRWWAREQPEVLAAEQLVADLDLRVAGRLDLICRLRDGRVAVVDAKTSGYLSAKFAAQVSAYAHLADVSGVGAPEVGIVLQVAEDGSFKPVEVPVEPDDFLLALRVYRRAGELTKQLRAGAKAAA